MLDRKFIIDNAELVQENCQHRGAQVDIRHFVELDAQRKEKQFEVDELNRQANAVSKTIGKAKDAQEREARKEEGRRLRDRTAAAQVELEPIIRELDELQRAIPNLSHPDVPVGVDDKSNLELRRGEHQPRQFDFKPLDHVELGEKLDLMDFEAGAKVTGHGFYYLKNEAVLLELALQRFAVDRLVKRGFTPMITPDLARNDILQGT